MDPTLLTAARAARGFMPDAEGWALNRAALEAGLLGPLLEIGSYCGKSALYLGSAARDAGTVLFTIDHHRGSEETQPGWEHHDPEVVDPRTGLTDTLPFLRRTVTDAGLEDAVILVVGESTTVARHWGTGLGLLFIDGGHALAIAMADYAAWSPHVLPGGLLAIHDVFENPAHGGQAPYRVWQQAVTDGFVPEVTVGSLRFLKRA